MPNNVRNVTTGKPKVGGAVFFAPLGSALPSDAKTSLAKEYICLGYVSDEGFTNTNSPDSDKKKAWGGDVVLTTDSGKEDTIKFTLIEVLNADVLKFVYGEDNVTIDEKGKIAVVANSSTPENCVVVVDMVARGGKAMRFIAPSAKITKIDDIEYQDGEAVGYGIEMSCEPCRTYDTVFTADSDATHITYIE